jgi:hypothetical protein
MAFIFDAVVIVSLLRIRVSFFEMAIAALEKETQAARHVRFMRV